MLPLLGDLLDPLNLDRMVEQRMITARSGPRGLTLYDYTARAQFTRTWNVETLTCRGLVVRADGVVQARPFAKFFNVDEHSLDSLSELPQEPFVVYEKLDGTLIIASYNADGSTLLTTRGSFTSRQAMAARDLWPDGLRVPDGQTWLFELIAPWNRIVVDYRDRHELVLLAALDNVTGSDLPAPPQWAGSVVRRLDGLSDFGSVLEHIESLGPNNEGCVVRFAGGLRAKVKAAEYIRLHRLMTGVTARTIWEYLSTDQPIDPLVERVPDEYHRWVAKAHDEMRRQFVAIERDARAEHHKVAELPTRKEQALAIAGHPLRAVVFAMIDGKPYAATIWKMLRPDAADPFYVDRVEDS